MFCRQQSHYQLVNSKQDKEKAQEVLGDDLYFDLVKIESETLLDKTLFGFFDHCFKINEVLGKYGFFLKFFERRNVSFFY